jgi:hypothetical protein
MTSVLKIEPEALVHGPAEECTDGGEVAGGGFIGEAGGALLLVELLRHGATDLGRRTVHEAGELFQDGLFALDAGGGVPVEGEFVVEEGLDPIGQGGAVLGDGRGVDGGCTSDGFAEVAGVEGIEFSNASELLGKAVQTGLAFVEAGEMFHGNERVTLVPHSQPKRHTMRKAGRKKWCAMQGLNLRPLPCQDSWPKAGCNNYQVTLEANMLDARILTTRWLAILARRVKVAECGQK